MRRTVSATGSPAASRAHNRRDRVYADKIDVVAPDCKIVYRR
jgi:hypothetical protein